MPSFLAKVFGRKKGDEKESATPRSAKRSSDPSLLEGKFEAIPSTVSPSSPKFPDDPHASEKGKDKSGPFGLLRSKSKPHPSSPTSDAPHLTLRLPGTVNKNDDSLVASFNPQADGMDDSILTRRLTPAETLLLIDACSKAITERGGLETLGVMRPHWHSASPQLQRKLISLFILSLAQQGPDTTLALSTSPSAAFNSELEYTRSVHDIAAVFRWGLRHLHIEGPSFGSSSSSDEWSWYHSFCEAERKSAYDPQVFTTKLVPDIPSTHTTLLIPVLDIISSLAAHAEANGYSGSKLSKYFGFWLLTARRGAGTEDWNSFYARWEDSGRMLEHLFLAWLRDQNTKRPLPRRLQELVAQYPYTTSPDPTADGLLTRPRFSTRRHDALFVRVEAVYADNVQTQPSWSPVGIFTDALKSEPKSDSGEHVYLWDQVKVAATSDSDDKPLLAILSDDTINLLSLVSTDPKDRVLLGVPGAVSTLVTPLSPITKTPLPATTNGNGVAAPVRKLTLPSSTPQSPKDWAEFSSAGFGEVTISKNFASTLLDKDLEITEPPVRRKSSKQKQGRSIASNRTSAELSSPVSKPSVAPEEPEAPKLVLVATEVVHLDEAFIDFWRDAIVDPVSSDWPKFVVGELKHPLIPHSSEAGEKAHPDGSISWIIIEEKFRRLTPPPTPVVPHEAPTSGGLKVTASPLKRTSSPRPSFGEKKGSFSASLRRFTLFGGSKDDLAEDDNPAAGGSGKKDGSRKKAGASKSPNIGELGEVLSEEPEPQPELQPEVAKNVDEPKRGEKRGEAGEGEDKVVPVFAGVIGGAAVGAVPATAEDVHPLEETKEKVTKTGTATKDDELPVPPRDDSPVVGAKIKLPVTSPPATPITSTIEVPTPAVEEPEQVQKSLPEIPPAVEETPRSPTPAAIEEVVPETVVDEPTELEPVPTTLPLAAEETTTWEQGRSPRPGWQAPEEPTPEVVEEPRASVVETGPEILPPAPESIVSHGETPGPQLALDSTEAGLHHVLQPAARVEERLESGTYDIGTPEFGTQSPEPVIEHLEDKAQDPAADAGVDLDPVPILSNDPVGPAEVEQAEEPVEVEPETSPELQVADITPTIPEPQPEPPSTTHENTEEPAAQADVPVTGYTPFQPTDEDKGDFPVPPLEDSQPAITNTTPPLPSTHPALSDPESVDAQPTSHPEEDGVTEDTAPPTDDPAASAPDESAHRSTKSELYNPTEETA